MDALIAANTVPLAQAPAPPATGTPGYPTDGVPGVTQPTAFPAYHYGGLIQELLNLIKGAGITPDRNNLGQVLAAVQALAGGPSAAEAQARAAGDAAEAQEAQARAAGDAAALAAAEAFASGLFAGSLATNPGWAQIKVGAASPSGMLLLQWGVSTTGLPGTPGVGTDVITFPQAFAKCCSLQLTIANAYTFVQVIIASGPLGPAQVVVETTRTTDGSAAGQIQYNWFAIGY